MWRRVRAAGLSGGITMEEMMEEVGAHEACGWGRRGTAISCRCEFSGWLELWNMQAAAIVLPVAMESRPSHSIGVDGPLVSMNIRDAPTSERNSASGGRTIRVD